ncbi:hypothetical protein D1Z90_07995 [Motilimonas pumila]|uniref:Uncharacterized protein n=1 Tax=Motilimonas pumila TaxID=2303987 RepID=A0A418YFZ7_9GAMM|nr:hypothetical protein D1Z90_07995 [Motilimonas pumila]
MLFSDVSLISDNADFYVFEQSDIDCFEGVIGWKTETIRVLYCLIYGGSKGLNKYAGNNHGVNNKALPLLRCLHSQNKPQRLSVGAYFWLPCIKG